MLRIALVQPIFEKLIDPTIDPPLGLLILAQILRREGHNVQVFSDNDFSTSPCLGGDCGVCEAKGAPCLGKNPPPPNPPTPLVRGEVRGGDRGDCGVCVPSGGKVGASEGRGDKAKGAPFDSRLLAFDCVGISFTTPVAYRSYKLADQLRTKGIKTIGGGAHVSALPDEALEHFDAVVIGEGESVISAAIAGAGKYYGFPLDSFENPAWDLYQFSQTRTLSGMPAIMIETSRGCNYHCAFCNSSVLSKVLRYKPLVQIEAEVKWLMSKGYKAFKITDDDFTADEVRASQIAEMFGNLGVKYRVFSHIRGMSYDFAKHLLETGCVSCGVGIETCDDWLLKLMNKPQRYRDIESGLVELDKAGLQARLFLIVGFPGETDESIEITISRLGKLPWHSYACFSCIPYPGTRLFAEPARYGITYISRNWDEYAQIDKDNNVPYLMDTDSFSRDDVRRRRERIVAELGMSRTGIRAGQNV